MLSEYFRVKPNQQSTFEQVKTRRFRRKIAIKGSKTIGRHMVVIPARVSSDRDLVLWWTEWSNRVILFRIEYLVPPVVFYEILIHECWYMSCQRMGKLRSSAHARKGDVIQYFVLHFESSRRAGWNASLTGARDAECGYTAGGIYLWWFAKENAIIRSVG